MNTLEELIYYCNESEPIGALMLTGEWGCGKTYLLENDLPEKLKESHVFVRVSLFGIGTIDALNILVKKRWLECCRPMLSSLNDSKLADVSKKIIGPVCGLLSGTLKDISTAALAINPMDYVNISPKVSTGGEEKKVVLIFDDLERAKLETRDILGCINDYCENNHFNTIIVANEEKMIKSSTEGHALDGSLSYAEIKEKIVCRTIQHKADYRKVIHSILQKNEWNDKEYKKFLLDQEDLIVSAFDAEKNAGNNGLTQKPRNIRSLKCALQDFGRVYQKLVEYDLEEKDQYLYSFIAYSILTKTGRKKEDEPYGDIGFDIEVNNYYASFSRAHLFEAARKWIRDGEWDTALIDREIAQKKEAAKSLEPKDKLRLSRIFEIDDEDMYAGAVGLLDDCYHGRPSLDDYILFIENSCWIRRYKIRFPEEIDWTKIMKGVQKRIEDIMAGNEEEKPNIIHNLLEKDRKYFSVEELRVYDRIDRFRKSGAVLFKTNKALYLSSIREKKSLAFQICKDQRFDVFDAEMAAATIDAFAECKQSERILFCNFFYKFWEKFDLNDDVNLEETVAGYKELETLLESLRDNYTNNGQSIAAIPTNKFIENVRKLIAVTEETIKMKKKILVILAAGLGTRFGAGIKQLQSVDDYGHIIIDYSIHDAIAAGFKRIVFIIRKDIEADFMAVIGKRIEAVCTPLGVEVAYAFQEMEKHASDVPEGRRKPWGTGHAVLCAAEEIDSPFAVINADDYYGKNGFIQAAPFLDNGKYGLVGYVLKNTLSDNGGVTRGICSVKDGKLTGIKETKHIKKCEGGAEADGVAVDIESLVSMNFWCYPAEFVRVLEEGFPKFLNGMTDVMQDEYLLPIIADGMLKDGTEFTVLPTDDRWFGVTFKEDQAGVEESFRRLIDSGVYKADLYSDL